LSLLAILAPHVSLARKSHDRIGHLHIDIAQTQSLALRFGIDAPIASFSVFITSVLTLRGGGLDETGSVGWGEIEAVIVVGDEGGLGDGTAELG
jgi:hypothetical protein